VVHYLICLNIESFWLPVQIFGAPVNFVTAPGWLMCVAWCIYLLLIILFFKEPERPSPLGLVSKQASEKNLAGLNKDDTSTLHQPLLSTLSGKLPSSLTSNLPKCEQSDEEEGEVEDYSDYGDDKAVETVGELLKELTMPIKILLWIYFMLKFASELLISESSILTQYYFNWTTSQVSPWEFSLKWRYSIRHFSIHVHPSPFPFGTILMEHRHFDEILVVHCACTVIQFHIFIVIFVTLV